MQRTKKLPREKKALPHPVQKQRLDPGTQSEEKKLIGLASWHACLQIFNGAVRGQTIYRFALACQRKRRLPMGL